MYNKKVINIGIMGSGNLLCSINSNFAQLLLYHCMVTVFVHLHLSNRFCLTIEMFKSFQNAFRVKFTGYWKNSN